MKPRIHILGTGGTIAGLRSGLSAHGYRAGSLVVEALIAAVPGLDAEVRITGEQPVNIPSQDMADAVWLDLARRLEVLRAEPDIAGIVMTHGTDTLEETAWFLDLVLDLPMPLVLTGAMRPANAPSADGPGNLADAVAVAADPAARGRGALVVMDGDIHATRDVIKSHTTRVGAFRSPERGPVGRIHAGHATFFAPPPPRPPRIALGDRDRLPLVLILHAHAGMGPELVRAAVAAGAEGIVVAGVGNGNLTAPALGALAEARRQGVAIVRSTRVEAGPVLQNGEVEDDRLGFVAAGELKPAKARVLLQLALLAGGIERVRAMFEQH